MNTEQQRRNQTKVLRVFFRAFAVKDQPRIHREAAKSAKISREKSFPASKGFFSAFSACPR